MRKHCWLKLWLMYVASIARLRGELKELPSSCGGSLAVSLTVSKSGRESYRLRLQSVNKTANQLHYNTNTNFHYMSWLCEYI